jgi:hypothetical protein
MINCDKIQCSISLRKYGLLLDITHDSVNNSVMLSPSREAASCGASQELTQNFMEPEISLPCLQESSTVP